MKCCNYYCKKAFAFLFFAPLVISSTSVRRNFFPSQTEEGNEFNYDEGSGKGPSNWGSLKQKWQTCGTGKWQSPIDIPVGSTLISPSLGDLQRSYASRCAVLKNREHDIAVSWNGNAGKININRTDFKLLQCHWHSPSEHTFGGIRHDLEIHIVHQNAQNQIAVVSVVFQIGQADPFLSALLSSIKCVGGGEKELGNVNPVDIGFAGRKYYRYTGSRTTPPCTEGVVWTVFEEVKTASTEQIQALKDALAEEFKENSRPTQSLGGRPVLFYDPWDTGNEFNYDEGSGKGPSNWGSLKQEWQTCGTGKSQSPIDIPVGSTLISPFLGDLQRSYASRYAVLKNREHDIAVLWKGDAGKININGTDFKLLQCHWHSPSEHTFGGTRHDLEIHIVHQNAQNEIAVVSMVFQIGQADPFLSALLPSIRCVGGGEKELGNINPVDIGFVGRKYYRYTGSLTTPPCTEGVVWTVFQEVKTASTEQVQALKDSLAEELKENSRPTQSLCGRPVVFYDPWDTGACS